MADSESHTSTPKHQDEASACMACHKAQIAYECMPCSCATLCKNCAMKMATGGKCKKCGELFTELRLFRRNRAASVEELDGSAPVEKAEEAR